MKQIEEGINVMTRPWKGSCHICRAEFESTGEEIEALDKGGARSQVSRIHCPACGAYNLYMSPQYVRTKKQEEKARLRKEETRQAMESRSDLVESSIELIVFTFDHKTGSLYS